MNLDMNCGTLSVKILGYILELAAKSLMKIVATVVVFILIDRVAIMNFDDLSVITIMNRLLNFVFSRDLTITIVTNSKSPIGENRRSLRLLFVV